MSLHIYQFFKINFFNNRQRLDLLKEINVQCAAIAHAYSRKKLMRFPLIARRRCTTTKGSRRGSRERTCTSVAATWRVADAIVVPPPPSPSTYSYNQQYVKLTEYINIAQILITARFFQIIHLRLEFFKLNPYG